MKTMKNTSGQQENGKTDSSPIPSISFSSAPLQSIMKTTMNKFVLIRNQLKKKKKEKEKLESFSRKLVTEFPGSPLIRTPHFHCQGWVQLLLRELRSQKPCDMPKRKKKFNLEKKKAI